MNQTIRLLGAGLLGTALLACGDKDEATDDSSTDDTASTDDTGEVEIEYGVAMDYAVLREVATPDDSGTCTQAITATGEAFGGATACEDCTYAWTFTVDTQDASTTGNYPSEECPTPDAEETFSMGWAPSLMYDGQEYGPILMYYYYDTYESLGGWDPVPWDEASADYGADSTVFTAGFEYGYTEDGYTYGTTASITITGSAGAYPQK